MAMEGSLAGDGFHPSVGGPLPLPPLPPPPPPPLSPPPSSWTELSRKEKRKARKKTKRKQERQQLRILEEERLRDPSEQAKLRLQEATEAQTLENLKWERDVEEQRWLEREQQAHEEAKRRKLQEEEDRQLREQQAAAAEEEEGGGDWEYVEEGPAEIIWEGNEIIVKKRKVKVPKRRPDLPDPADDPNRPTSNPFAPATPAFADYDQKAAPTSMQDLVEQNPNFGTEQDKTHCPFHIKTGVCRFGTRCSRAHVYPDKSCTLLMKNMYSGPGLTWEHDEGLEYMDEEISQHFEEFYEDVHAEFLKFGEIVNFKVCKNASAHLRGNVYVHYHTIESAVSAYQAMNARFYAGKQISFEFVGVTRWKIAICGEYLKSRYQNCSHGLACNFLHCFRNPGGAYDWADWDGPPPRFWLRKMEQLFGGNKSKDSYRRKGDYKRPHKHGHSSHSTHGSKHWNGNSSCSEDEKRGRRSHSHKEEMQHWSRSHHQKYRSDSESSSSGSTRDRRGRQESQHTRKHHAERYYAETEERELERDGNSNHALRNRSCSRGKGRTCDSQNDDRWRLDVDTSEDANAAQCPRKEQLSNGKLGSHAKRSHSSGLESDDNHEPRGNRRCRRYYEEDEDNRSRKDKKSSRRYQSSDKWSNYSGSHTQYSDDECALRDRSHRNSYEDESVAHMRVSERSQRCAKENSSPGSDPQVSGKEYAIRHKTRLRNIHQNHRSHASEFGTDLEISGDRREKPKHRHSYRRAGKRSSVSTSSGDEYVTSPKRPRCSSGKRISPKRKIEDKRDLNLDVYRGE